jgi:glycosyltransferase involved in cell wall biosynthesis
MALSGISVVIPAYNRADHIGETVRSLLVQTVPADEIVVVDDGSIDNTAEVAASFGAPVRVIRQPNRGPAAARNAGFRETKGEYLHFFDSDDLAAANKHEVQRAALECTGADIAYGPWVKGAFRGDWFYLENQVLQQRGLPQRCLIRALLSHWSIVPHAALFRRSIVEACNGFPEDLVVAEDQFMFLSCLLLNAQVVHTPGTIEFYRTAAQGKITEANRWSLPRLTQWAGFLIKAREACVAQGIEPLRWFGYRRRVWQVWMELRQSSDGPDPLIDALYDLIGTRYALALYPIARKIQDWRGGLQRRLTSARGDSSFRMGPITTEQSNLLLQLGYRWAPRNVTEML